MDRLDRLDVAPLVGLHHAQTMLVLDARVRKIRKVRLALPDARLGALQMLLAIWLARPGTFERPELYSGGGANRRFHSASYKKQFEGAMGARGQDGRGVEDSTFT